MSAVTISSGDQVAVITVDDDKANVLTAQVLPDLTAALEEAESGLSPIVLAGRPGRFSAGFDLHTLAGGNAEAPALLRAGFEFAERIRTAELTALRRAIEADDECGALLEALP